LHYLDRDCASIVPNEPEDAWTSSTSSRPRACGPPPSRSPSDANGPSTPAPQGDAMTGWDIAGGLIAVGLFIYPVAVLLRPEDFS
jgi:K+-transporting ATPase KdpF subunit